MSFKNLGSGSIILVMSFLTMYASTKKLPVQAGNIPEFTRPPVPEDTTKTDAFLENILQQYPRYFENILQNRKDLNVQVIYTQVDKGANGIAALKSYYFNVNGTKYFYPASTVKLPVSLLALQKLNELKINGLDKNSAMITEESYSGQSAVYNDPSTFSGKPSIGQYIKKILMVSDNDAFNRLYEFLGQEYINDQLHKMDYGDVQVLHRLDIALSPEENRHTNAIKFFSDQQKVLYYQPPQASNVNYTQRTDSIGKAFIKNGQLVDGPMDFSLKNRVSLEDLHNILVSLVLPNKVADNQRFNITAEDRNFILKYMSQFPGESIFPPYSADTASYWPAYCKFLLFGSEKGPLPKNIRIFNKVGDAYGQLTDVAYIVDYEKKIEFFLSATIYCNKDGVLNDDQYDYESIGFPFMKHLGEAIYNYELNRTKKVLPDLSSMIFSYDRP